MSRKVSVMWRARNVLSDQILATYMGHELIIFPARRFAWAGIVDGMVWTVDGIPVNWPSEAGAMVGLMDIADAMEKRMTRPRRILSLTPRGTHRHASD